MLFIFLNYSYNYTQFTCINLFLFCNRNKYKNVIQGFSLLILNVGLVPFFKTNHYKHDKPVCCFLLYGGIKYKKDNTITNVINSELMLYCYALFFHIRSKSLCPARARAIALNTVLSLPTPPPPPAAAPAHC